MNESSTEEGRRQSILKLRVRAPLQEVPYFFPDDDTSTFTRSRRVSFGKNLVKEFLVGSAASTQAFQEYEQSSESLSEPSDCSGPLDLALNKSSCAMDVSMESPSLVITPPESFTDGGPSESNKRVRRFTEGCISLAKSVFENGETEMTAAIIINAKPAISEEDKRNASSMSFTNLDISHSNALSPKSVSHLQRLRREETNFVPMRHHELMNSSVPDHENNPNFDFLGSPVRKKPAKPPRSKSFGGSCLEPKLAFSRLSQPPIPWENENDENVPPAAHMIPSRVKETVTVTYEDSMEFTCAGRVGREFVAEAQLHDYSDMETTLDGPRFFRCTSDMEETLGRPGLNQPFVSANNPGKDFDGEDCTPATMAGSKSEFLLQLASEEGDNMNLTANKQHLSFLKSPMPTIASEEVGNDEDELNLILGASCDDFLFDLSNHEGSKLLSKSRNAHASEISLEQNLLQFPKPSFMSSLPESMDIDSHPGFEAGISGIRTIVADSPIKRYVAPPVNDCDMELTEVILPLRRQLSEESIVDTHINAPCNIELSFEKTEGQANPALIREVGNCDVIITTPGGVSETRSHNDCDMELTEAVLPRHYQIESNEESTATDTINVTDSLKSTPENLNEDISDSSAVAPIEEVACPVLTGTQESVSESPLNLCGGALPGNDFNIESNKESTRIDALNLTGNLKSGPELLTDEKSDTSAIGHCAGIRGIHALVSESPLKPCAISENNFNMESTEAILPNHHQIVSNIESTATDTLNLRSASENLNDVSSSIAPTDEVHNAGKGGLDVSESPLDCDMELTEAILPHHQVESNIESIATDTLNLRSASKNFNEVCSSNIESTATDTLNLRSASDVDCSPMDQVHSAVKGVLDVSENVCDMDLTEATLPHHHQIESTVTDTLNLRSASENSNEVSSSIPSMDEVHGVKKGGLDVPESPFKLCGAVPENDCDMELTEAILPHHHQIGSTVTDTSNMRSAPNYIDGSPEMPLNRYGSLPGNNYDIESKNASAAIHALNLTENFESAPEKRIEDISDCSTITPLDHRTGISGILSASEFPINIGGPIPDNLKDVILPRQPAVESIIQPVTNVLHSPDRRESVLENVDGVDCCPVVEKSVVDLTVSGENEVLPGSVNAVFDKADVDKNGEASHTPAEISSDEIKDYAADKCLMNDVGTPFAHEDFVADKCVVNDVNPPDESKDFVADKYLMNDVSTPNAPEDFVADKCVMNDVSPPNAPENFVADEFVMNDASPPDASKNFVADKHLMNDVSIPNAPENFVADECVMNDACPPDVSKDFLADTYLMNDVTPGVSCTNEKIPTEALSSTDNGHVIVSTACDVDKDILDGAVTGSLLHLPMESNIGDALQHSLIGVEAPEEVSEAAVEVSLKNAFTCNDQPCEVDTKGRLLNDCNKDNLPSPMLANSEEIEGEFVKESAKPSTLPCSDAETLPERHMQECDMSVGLKEDSMLKPQPNIDRRATYCLKDRRLTYICSSVDNFKESIGDNISKYNEATYLINNSAKHLLNTPAENQDASAIGELANVNTKNHPGKRMLNSPCLGEGALKKNRPSTSPCSTLNNSDIDMNLDPEVKEIIRDIQSRTEVNLSRLPSIGTSGLDVSLSLNDVSGASEMSVDSTPKRCSDGTSVNTSKRKSAVRKLDETLTSAPFTEPHSLMRDSQTSSAEPPMPEVFVPPLQRTLNSTVPCPDLSKPLELVNSSLTLPSAIIPPLLLETSLTEGITQSNEGMTNPNVCSTENCNQNDSPLSNTGENSKFVNRLPTSMVESDISKTIVHVEECLPIEQIEQDLSQVMIVDELNESSVNVVAEDSIVSECLVRCSTMKFEKNAFGWAGNASPILTIEAPESNDLPTPAHVPPPTSTVVTKVAKTHLRKKASINKVDECLAKRSTIKNPFLHQEDSRVHKYLVEQMKENGCFWKISNFQACKGEQLGEIVIDFPVLDDTLVLTLNMKYVEEVCRIETTRIVRRCSAKYQSKYQLAVSSFAFDTLKHHILQGTSKATDFAQVQYILDFFNSSTRKINDVAEQLVRVLKGCPSTKFDGRLLNVRVLSFPFSIMSWIHVDVLEMIQMPQPRLQFSHEWGPLDEGSIATLFTKCWKAPEPLIDFTRSLYNYMLELERPTGRITKRAPLLY